MATPRPITTAPRCFHGEAQPVDRTLDDQFFRGGRVFHAGTRVDEYEPQTPIIGEFGEQTRFTAQPPGRLASWGLVRLGIQAERHGRCHDLLPFFSVAAPVSDV